MQTTHDEPTKQEQTEIAQRIGRHPNMSDAEYFGMDMLSSTVLRALDRSPAYARMAMRGEIPVTDAMRFGSRVDALIFGQALDIAPVAGDWRFKEAKAEKDAVLERGQIPVKPDVYQAVYDCADSVMSHPRVRDLVESSVHQEVTIWERDGHLCKAKKDGRAGDVLWDLKTCNSLDRFSPWKITDMSYHVQAAWYADGEIRCKEGTPAMQFWWVAVCSSPPYEVAIYEATNETMSHGFREADQLFETWKQCVARDSWPRHFLNRRPGEIHRRPAGSF